MKTFLFRAVQELLFNIVKHAGVESAKVALSGFDHGIRITISDRGRGFNPDELAGNGKSGLGLANLRERAFAIGGSLDIESAPGQVFVLTVPAEVAAPEPPAGTHIPSGVKHEGVRPTTAGQIRVLIADDHKVMRQGLISLVSGQPDIRVVGEAANGEEALELTRKLNPHVVIMDVSMPEMDGADATRLIKAELPQVKVIGLSMYDDKYIIKRMRMAGADGFVSKNASSAELLQVIYDASGRGRGWQACGT